MKIEKTMQVIYLYGFASGPLSNKAQFFKRKFESVGVNFQIYDYVLNPHEFRDMKLSELQSNLHEYLSANFPNEKVILMGSSFGGLLVTWYAHLHPEKIDQLILIAPALQFSAEFITETLDTSFQEWELKGETEVEHYRFGGSIPLNYSFIKDIKQNPIPTFSRDDFPVSTIIFHGENDQVVPHSWSISLAHANPRVDTYIMKGDHQLLNHRINMWNEIVSKFKLK